MSKERSPRAVCSTTIGTSGIFSLSFSRSEACVLAQLLGCAFPQPSRCATMELRIRTEDERSSPMTLPRSEGGPAQAEAVTRSVDLDAPPAEVWDALTEEALLGEWLADEVELQAEPGGEIVCRYADGEERRGEVELVEEAERLAWTWWREDA